MDAIHTLHQLEIENRNATEPEQEILSKYVGWGGLADAFDEKKDAWADEYHELKNALTEEEYAAARESTLNAHYTSPVIIRGIYRALEQIGFRGGNILEPSMGIGNFFECCQIRCRIAGCMVWSWILSVVVLRRNYTQRHRSR